jgi:hypothetical protein
MNLIFSFDYLSTEANVRDLKYSKPSSNERNNFLESGAFDKINFYIIKQDTETFPWK